MIDKTNEFEFAGFWKRVLAALLDAVIGWAFMPFGFLLLKWTATHRNMLPTCIWNAIWIYFWLWFVVRFGGTPGKLLIRLRIVDTQGKFLRWKKAILRMLFPGLLISINSLLQMWKAFGTYPADSTPHSLLEIGTIMNTYGQPFAIIATLLGLAVYVDIGAVLFNPKKRAIHDFIADSYVITKKSYLEQSDETENAEDRPPSLPAVAPEETSF